MRGAAAAAVGDDGQLQLAGYGLVDSVHAHTVHRSDISCLDLAYTYGTQQRHLPQTPLHQYTAHMPTHLRVGYSTLCQKKGLETV